MKKLAEAWYTNPPWLWILWPLSMLFAMASASRRWLYQSGILPSSHADALVVVVGNISVGGNGKTPVVIALVEHFQARQVRVGVLSRGYGGQCEQHPHLVADDDSADRVGDEPRLIASRTGAPVVIDPVRKRGARMLAEDLHCEVIICDDGLQHYALKRDVELVVMDERRYGNGRLLPMGPLREGVWRLDTVDGIVHNVRDYESARLLSVKVPQYHMTLQSGWLVNVCDPEQTLSIADFNQRYPQCTAIAGIGNPGRFFRQLSRQGLPLVRSKAFDDHHPFEQQDIPAGAVVMTEKDAVKIGAFAHPDCWYLPVSARLDTSLFDHLTAQLEQRRKRT